LKVVEPTTVRREATYTLVAEALASCVFPVTSRVEEALTAPEKVAVVPVRPESKVVAPPTWSVEPRIVAAELVRVLEALMAPEKVETPPTWRVEPKETAPEPVMVEEALMAPEKVPVVAVIPARKFAAPPTWSVEPRMVAPEMSTVEEARRAPVIWVAARFALTEA
jgi:hypothetical protein